MSAIPGVISGCYFHKWSCIAVALVSPILGNIAMFEEKVIRIDWIDAFKDQR